MLRINLWTKSISVLLVFTLSIGIVPGSLDSQTETSIHLAPDSFVQAQAQLVGTGSSSAVIGALATATAGLVLTSTKPAQAAPSDSNVAPWRKSINAGLARVREAQAQIDEQPTLSFFYYSKLWFGQSFVSIFAVFAVFTAIIASFKSRVTRRRFMSATGVLAVTATAGCTTTGSDRVTGADITQNFNSGNKLPDVLNFSLERFLGDAIKLNMGLRRLFFDHYLATVVKPLAEEASGDLKITASLSAIFNGSTTPDLAAGLFASGDFLGGNWNSAYQTHGREEQIGTINTVPANLTAATIANDATGALNAINPELYYTIPVTGDTVPNPDEVVPEAIRASFRHELNKITHEVGQAYQKIVELKQDLTWLQQQKALIEAIPAGDRTNPLTTKLGEINTAIANTNHPLQSAYLDLLKKVGYRGTDFNVEVDRVRINPQSSIALVFDETNTTTVPVLNQAQSRERMRTNSIQYVRLTQQMNLSETAIGAAKYNASRPNVTLAFGYEPRAAGLVGLLTEIRPWRFRAAEAQIMELRTKYLGFSAARAQQLTGITYSVAQFVVDRSEAIRLTVAKRNAFQSLDTSVGTRRAYLANSSHVPTAPAQLQANIASALSGSAITVANVAELVQLLEAKRGFQSEIRKFNHLESSRHLLEGTHIGDTRTGQVLAGLKDYFDPFIRQDPIYFHNLLSGGVKMFWWVMLSIGTALGATLFPTTALAAQSRVPTSPPAIRWSAPEMAPLYREPAFATSL